MVSPVPAGDDDDGEDALFVKDADGTLRLLRDTERTKKGRDGKTRVMDQYGEPGPVVVKTRMMRGQGSDHHYFVAGSAPPQVTGGLTVSLVLYLLLIQ